MIIWSEEEQSGGDKVILVLSYVNVFKGKVKKTIKKWTGAHLGGEGLTK